MAIEFKLPELGENIESGEVVNVLVAVGDAVAEGQSILEIEAGKASMEIPSPTAGTIEAIHVAQGDTVAVGQLAFTISDGAAAAPAPEADAEPETESAPPPKAAAKAVAPGKPAAPPAPAVAAGKIEFKLPELGENIEGGEVVNVLVAVGDAVAEGQSILEIEAGKASMEIPSPVAGTIAAVHIAQGDTVKVGQLAFTIEGGAADAPAEKPNAEAPKAAPTPQPVAPKPAAPAAQKPVPVAEKAPAKAPEPASAAKAVAAAPNVRRLARELGVDIHEVAPSTPGGRISMEDVKNYAKQSMAGGGAKASPNAAGAVRVEKMSQIRKATMAHMTHCWTTIPHVTQHDMADITKLEELRKRFAPKAEAVGAKLTVTAILVKVVAAALKVYPKFNASIDPEKAEIIYKEFYNIGIAVDTEKGLMVPVIRDADKKNMVGIAQDLGGIAKKAREGQISLADMQGGTFTITNLGGIGGSFFTPIVNSPEVAILGVGKAIMDPCIGKNELCAPRLRMPLSLSYDHRIIDGADGARFLRWIVEAIEEPMLISLEG